MTDFLRNFLLDTNLSQLADRYPGMTLGQLLHDAELRLETSPDLMTIRLCRQAIPTWAESQAPQKIHAIKYLRTLTNGGLKDCKDAVDRLDEPGHYHDVVVPRAVGLMFLRTVPRLNGFTFEEPLPF